VLIIGFLSGWEDGWTAVVMRRSWRLKPSLLNAWDHWHFVSEHKKRHSAKDLCRKKKTNKKPDILYEVGCG